MCKIQLFSRHIGENMLTIKNYVRASSLQEAYDLYQKRSTKVMGGMMWLRMSNSSINTIVDLSELGLDTITENDEEFSIGAMVTLRQLELHETLNSYSNDAVKKAVQDIVGVQFRNGATVGGSIYGRFGFSDVLTVFLAMDTYVELFNAGIIPLSEYATMKPDRDLIVRLIVKKQPAQIAYQAMRIQKTDFPVLTCAVSNICGKYQAAIGARPGKAVLIPDSDNLLAEGITSDSAKAFGEFVAASIVTGSNMRGSAKYRQHLAKILTMRAVEEISKEGK